MVLACLASPSPATSGTNWLVFTLSLVGSFIVGAVTALLIQLYIVPRVETRKRREDRWENDVRSLLELLTVRLTSLANEAFAAQVVYREKRDDTTDQYSPALVREGARAAREATWGYGGLMGTQVGFLIERVMSIKPKAQEIERLKRLYGDYQQQAIFVRPLPADDKRTDAEFHKTWDKESEARDALIAQVKLLAGLRHPPT
jgi:hypothetical protein